MNSEIENSRTKNESSNEVKIEELRPRLKRVDLIFKVIEKSEVREVTSRRTFETQRIVDATVGDETGTVKLPLWNDTIESIDIGKTYRLEDGYTGLFRGHLQLKIGRHSELKDAESEIGDVNLNVDMSSENHRRSQPRHYYQPYDRSRNRDSRHDHYGRRRRRW